MAPAAAPPGFPWFPFRATWRPDHAGGGSRTTFLPSTQWNQPAIGPPAPDVRGSPRATRTHCDCRRIDGPPQPAAFRPYARSSPCRERPNAALADLQPLADLLAKVRATELAQKHLGLAGIRLNLLAGAAQDDAPASSLASLLAAVAARTPGKP